MIFLDNEIDGSVLLKLSEAMVVRLFPTIKLEVQFLDLLQSLKHRHADELNRKKPLPSSSAHIPPFDHGSGHSSNSNSPTSVHGHPPQAIKGPSMPLKTLKREPKFFLSQYESSAGNSHLIESFLLS